MQRARAPAYASTQHDGNTQTSTRNTNIEQNLKSLSTTNQQPPGMGLIYMKIGDRVEEDINHKIIVDRK